MKDELIKVIAEYLEAETNLIDLGNQMWVQFGGALNSGHFTHAGFCQEIAAEIAGKVLAVVEKKTGWEDAEKFDSDEIYTEEFKEWREKYFVPDGGKRRFTSKSNGVLYDDFGLQEKFKRAYNVSPIK